MRTSLSRRRGQAGTGRLSGGQQKQTALSQAVLCGGNPKPATPLLCSHVLYFMNEKVPYQQRTGATPKPTH